MRWNRYSGRSVASKVKSGSKDRDSHKNRKGSKRFYVGSRSDRTTILGSRLGKGIKRPTGNRSKRANRGHSEKNGGSSRAGNQWSSQCSSDGVNGQSNGCSGGQRHHGSSRWSGNDRKSRTSSSCQSLSNRSRRRDQI